MQAGHLIFICLLSGCTIRVVDRVRFTLEHVEQLLILQHDGSFYQILEVGVDPRSNSSILSHPLLRQDVNVVPHLERKTVNR